MENNLCCLIKRLKQWIEALANWKAGHREEEEKQRQ